MLDPVIASRLQFAVTTIVHIVFPVISMGLGPFLIYFTWKSIRSQSPVYEQLRRLWTRVFAITFVVGTVTGIVLEFEFGTNFAAFSSFAGELFAGPLAFEGLIAFMLEASFLGIFVFGRDRVGDRAYFLSSVAVGLGSWLSAVWILIANSWMQTPRGYEVVQTGGQEVIRLVDPLAAYLNPRFVWMFVHMQTGVVESVALLLAGIAAYQLSKRARDDSGVLLWRATLKVALVVLLITAPLQVIQGDLYARHVYHTQPEKFAAMEAIWETGRYVPEYIVAFPTSIEGLHTPDAKRLFGLGIPGGASWLASGGDPQAVIRGLNSFPTPHPPVAIVFWAFRIMVALGFWFVLLAFWGGVRLWRGGLYRDRLLLGALQVSAPLGILAVELGWIVTEVGRQPWVVQGLMKTRSGVSPGLSSTEATLTGFVLGYLALLIVYTVVIRRILDTAPPKRGPETDITGQMEESNDE
ncbi:cytochrome ubiquinol oxidase subunit I [Halocatena halophila]|uniref:cytochrome ubiquinol oxidase subunit I n=1 Tax=Halocatena halophila TaxID=2814576 RepID=UPI002ED3C2FD